MSLASLATAVLLCGWLVGARAQDLYRAQGRWVDDQARSFHFDALRDAPTVITLAYGACRRVCSTSLRMMQGLQALADERRVALNFVVIGIDPSQDRPADWAEFRAEHKLQRPNWHFLSGDEASTGALANRLGVRYWRYGEHTMHDFKIVLLSAQGQTLRSIDRFDQAVATLLP